MKIPYKRIQKLVFTPFFGFLMLSLLIQTIGAVGAKYAINNINSQSFFIQGILILGLFMFGTMALQALVWQKALMFYPLSFAYPFRSLINFAILFSAFFFFNETITILNVIGLTVITWGIFFLVRDEADLC
jgi:drug/metabolite transporter (DMT)-like permease